MALRNVSGWCEVHRFTARMLLNLDAFPHVKTAQVGCDAVVLATRRSRRLLNKLWLRSSVPLAAAEAAGHIERIGTEIERQWRDCSRCE